MRILEISDIVKEVCREWRINDMEIYAGGREQPLAIARMVVFYIARQCRYSVTYIGEKVNRDHSTVSHGINSLTNKMRKDHTLYMRVRRVAERCGVGMMGEAPPQLSTKKAAWDAAYTRAILLQTRSQLRDALHLLGTALDNIPLQSDEDMSLLPEPAPQDIPAPFLCGERDIRWPAPAAAEGVEV